MNNQTNTSKQPRFTAQTTMLECLTADPSLGMVLMRDFHLGGCRNCGFNPHDSIETVAQQTAAWLEQLYPAGSPQPQSGDRPAPAPLAAERA